MVNISKKKLKKGGLEKINNQLIETIYSLNTKSSINNFFNELFTSSEKILLTKRLAIIFMLYEKMSWYRIYKVLNVSIATIRKMAMKINRGEYNNILKIVRKKNNRKVFWMEMELILRGGMPPMTGKGRWKFLDELYKKYDIENNK